MKQNRNRPPLPVALCVLAVFLVAQFFALYHVVRTGGPLWVNVLMLAGAFAWLRLALRAEARYHRRWLAWRGREDIFPHCPNCNVRPGAAHTATCYVPELTNHEQIWSGEWPTIETPAVDYITEDGRRGRA